MMCPEIPPCDVSNLPDIDTVILVSVFGLMALVAVVAALKGWELVLTIREKRIYALNRRNK